MPKTVLAVDDSVTMRKVLEITFSGDDFNVLTAENGSAALAKVGEADVFLVDTVLGGEDGYALARELRQRAPHAGMILLASRYAPYDQARGRDAGADDFADKPFDTTQLLDKVKKVMLARESGAVTARQRDVAAVATPAVPTPVVQAPPQMQMPVAHAPHAPRPPLPTPGGFPRGTQPSLGGDAARAAQTLSANPAPQPVHVQPPPPAPVQAPPPVVQAPARPMTAPDPHAGEITRVHPNASQAAQDTASATRPAAGAPPPPPRPPEPPSAPSVAQAAPPTTPAQVVSTAVNGHMAANLKELGLTPEQAQAVLALSREVVERVVWEVVPTLAETLIKEEIARLMK